MAQIKQADAGITRYRWVTAGDLAVRGRPGGEYEDSQEDHWALNGTIHEWSNPPLIPGTRERSHPGGRIQCRCVAVPIVGYLDDPAPAPAPRTRAPAAARPPADLTDAGRRPLRQESLEFLRRGGAASEALPVRVRPDGTVVDGRHRIAVARERGERFITGDVVTLDRRGNERVRRGVRIPV